MIARQANAAFSVIPSGQADKVVDIGSSSAMIVVTEPIRAWSASVKAQLSELVKLDEGWDGYSAPPVAFVNANFALRMLEAACAADAPVPQIVPGSSGDLQIEWHTTRGDIELHVLGPNNVHAWRCTDSTAPAGEEINLTVDFTTIADWLKDITELPSAASVAAA